MILTWKRNSSLKLVILFVLILEQLLLFWGYWARVPSHLCKTLRELLPDPID